MFILPQGVFGFWPLCDWVSHPWLKGYIPAGAAKHEPLMNWSSAGVQAFIKSRLLVSLLLRGIQTYLRICLPTIWISRLCSELHFSKVKNSQSCGRAPSRGRLSTSTSRSDYAKLREVQKKWSAAPRTLQALVNMFNATLRSNWLWLQHQPAAPQFPSVFI